MRNLAFALTSLLIGVSASAALPPYWERAREIATIAQDQRVETAMKGKLIETVSYLEFDKYQVISGDCTVDVELHTIAPTRPMVGPRQFEVQVLKASHCD